MARITKEEVIKLAHLSQLDLTMDEVEKLVTDITSVLVYVSRLKEIADHYTIEEELPQAVNITRHDAIIPTDPEPILAQAPLREDVFFVVPAILKSTEPTL
jgi:aspartyl/glutamyl-tRNA(Asn/Gln) amidotransferase C subunit